jgi:hypothetical protein
MRFTTRGRRRRQRLSLRRAFDRECDAMAVLIAEVREELAQQEKAESRSAAE